MDGIDGATYTQRSRELDMCTLIGMDNSVIFVCKHIEDAYIQYST